jgi:hypothetical protein
MIDSVHAEVFGLLKRAEMMKMVCPNCRMHKSIPEDTSAFQIKAHLY